MFSECINRAFWAGGSSYQVQFRFRFFIPSVNLMFNFGHDFGVGQQFVFLIYEYTQSLSFSNTLKWKRRRFSVPNEWMNVFIYFHDRTSYFDCSSFMYCCCCLIRIIFVELGYAIHVKFASWYFHILLYTNVFVHGLRRNFYFNE